MNNPRNLWLIYSHEQKAWWSLYEPGFTLDIAEAGRYEEQEALDICWQANRYRSSVEQMPNDVMVPAPDVLIVRDVSGKMTFITHKAEGTLDITNNPLPAGWYTPTCDRIVDGCGA